MKLWSIGSVPASLERCNVLQIYWFGRWRFVPRHLRHWHLFDTWLQWSCEQMTLDFLLTLMEWPLVKRYIALGLSHWDNSLSKNKFWILSGRLIEEPHLSAEFHRIQSVDRVEKDLNGKPQRLELVPLGRDWRRAQRGGVWLIPDWFICCVAQSWPWLECLECFVTVTVDQMLVPLHRWQLNCSTESLSTWPHRNGC